MKLYFRYISMLLKCQMEYRTSFLLLSFAQFFVPFLVFVSIYLLFQRFPNIAGWSLYEVAFCYGIIHVCFSISECVGRGFDSFSPLVRKGLLDQFLLRPQSILLQVLGSQFEFTRIGRLIQSLVVLGFAIVHLDIIWNFQAIVTLIFMIVGGVFIFIGIFMLGATLCFWTIEGIELVNILTDGGREISQYPLNIYPEGIRRFFTFIIPFGVVNYIPLLFLVGKLEASSMLVSILYTATPLAGILFIFPCIFIWNLGLRHYSSTGS